MFLIASLLSLIIIHVIVNTSSSSSPDCESLTTIWTYYPCSFIISSSSSCQQASVNLAIDECINREIMFFWHFPSGNMTLILESDNKQSFLLQLSKRAWSKRRLIKNVYHLVDRRTVEKQLLLHNGDDNEEITIVSNEFNECSVKFETWNRMIYDYGMFIQMTILADKV